MLKSHRIEKKKFLNRKIERGDLEKSKVNVDSCPQNATTLKYMIIFHGQLCFDPE